jgi:hypothetical protein
MRKSHKVGKLNEAVMKGDLAGVKKAIEAGEDVDLLDREGRSPLFYAVTDGNNAIA